MDDVSGQERQENRDRTEDICEYAARKNLQMTTVMKLILQTYLLGSI